ncbi:hypothetical protein QN277_008368 [Acacia crassicarpa]|uniref:Uncharacterized protein n=1 Tax=Acacia crassicarpa TaxID=499986 RepID=A0AAE1IT98_9FABA|nr:hypothetical protein QN277_008368 [Acacia crassicarpa]
MAKPPSSSKKDLIVCADDLEQEESGWTSYFEDFSSNTNSSCFSFCGGDGFSSSSSVSDAASFAACKFSHPHNHNILSSNNNYGLPPNPPDMKLRFKKSQQAHHQILEDDPLEDTATSPLNSPKDGDLSPTEMISRKIADDHDLYADSTGKGFTSENVSDSKRDDDDEDDKNNTKGKNNMKNYTNMKKRGLSFFPLSMLVNYFG